MALPKPDFTKITDVPQKASDSTIPAGPKSLAHTREGQGDSLNAPKEAPEPGQVIPKWLSDKALLELEAQLTATKWVPGKEGSSGAWEQVPDFPVRQRAIELCFAYRHGKPVERQIKLTGNAGSYDDRLERLIATPEGLKVAIAAGLIGESDPRIAAKREKNVQSTGKK